VSPVRRGTHRQGHPDHLDLWAPVDQLPQLFVAMVAHGVDRIFPWPGDRPWNFVLHDGARLRVDLHLYEPLPDGETIHFGAASGGVTFPTEALGGHGRINGRAVRCEAPEWAVRWHTGYPPRDVDRHDVPLLCARYGVPLPDGFD
jgi:lincosamide nucleotidyltransferase A/C/D/E